MGPSEPYKAPAISKFMSMNCLQGAAIYGLGDESTDTSANADVSHYVADLLTSQTSLVLVDRTARLGRPFLAMKTLPRRLDVRRLDELSLSFVPIHDRFNGLLRRITRLMVVAHDPVN